MRDEFICPKCNRATMFEGARKGTRVAGVQVDCQCGESFVLVVNEGCRVQQYRHVGSRAKRGQPSEARAPAMTPEQAIQGCCCRKCGREPNERERTELLAFAQRNLGELNAAPADVYNLRPAGSRGITRHVEWECPECGPN